MLIRPICRPAICCCDDVCCCWTKPKVLHDAVVASGGPTTLYTVPAGFCAEIDSFIVQETGAAALTFSGYYDPNAVGVGTATILDKDIALAADGRHELVGAKPLPLGAGGVLAIQTNTANARVVIVGRLAPI